MALPAFVKIDVEGFEDRVLAGPEPAAPGALLRVHDDRRATSRRAASTGSRALGPYRFDLALGETQRLAFGRWLSCEEMAAHLAGLPHEANSGDVYAVLGRARPSTQLLEIRSCGCYASAASKAEQDAYFEAQA